jgi:succinoglycan biosynthesis protein ExoA
VRLLVVVPCLNEEAHLPALLDTLRNDPAAADARIVVVDGGSTDASAEIVLRRAEHDARLTLLNNPKRVQSAGVNLAVRAFGAEAELFARVDAHAAYPGDFLTQLVQAQADSGADSVTVSMRATAADGACFQEAAACAQNSLLGAGGSPHRKGGARRWVDHGHHALFRTQAFLAAGGYDESFTHNEDAELDVRLTANGGRILLAADILIDYFPRRDASALARQYFKHGQGRARTMLKHRIPPKARQLAPAAVAPALLFALGLGPLAPVAALPAAAWLCGCLVYGLVLGARRRSACACASGAAAAIMHVAWSSGFLAAVAANLGAAAGLRERAA